MDMHAISFSMSLFNKKYSPVWRGGWMCVEAILWTTDLSQKKTLTKYLSKKHIKYRPCSLRPNFVS